MDRRQGSIIDQALLACPRPQPPEGLGHPQSTGALLPTGREKQQLRPGASVRLGR